MGFLDIMTPFEIYIFIVCLIVYVLLVSLSAIMLTIIIKSTLKLIRVGAEDDKIKKEYFKQLKKGKKSCLMDYIATFLMCAVLLVVFAFSVGVGLNENKYNESIPTFKIVNTGSMSKKNPENEYLFDNDLDNQFQAFDLILVYKLPKEEDLKLYDIVVYEVDGVMIVHRIINIEEPNQHHPDERWFQCQGDANSVPDRFPVKYSQMRAVYRGEKVPFIGSFVAFMQSPAGYMCIILVVVAVIGTPILERLIENAKRKRLMDIGVITDGFEVDTFEDRLENASDNLKNIYGKVAGIVTHIDTVRINERKDALLEVNCLLKASLLLKENKLIVNTQTNKGLVSNQENKYYLKPIALNVYSATDNRWLVNISTAFEDKVGLVINGKALYYENGVDKDLVSAPKAQVNAKHYQKRLNKLSDEFKKNYSDLIRLLDKIDVVRIQPRKTDVNGWLDGEFARITVRIENNKAVAVVEFNDAEMTKRIVEPVMKPALVRLVPAERKNWNCVLTSDMCYGNGLTVKARAEYTAKMNKSKK